MSASRSWCQVCCTDHSHGTDCPGELAASGEERHGWRVNVETPRGMEAFGVLIAESYGLWRARILSYPNILWLVPGGGGTLKFVGSTPQEAERRAAEFIRTHCRERGFTIRPDLDEVAPEPIDRELAQAVLELPNGPPARRKVRFLPVLFGVASTTDKGRTGDLSETGLFVITDSPAGSGSWLNMVLEPAPGQPELSLRGVVRWARKAHHEGRSPGMGVQLEAPPRDYTRYVQSLP